MQENKNSAIEKTEKLAVDQTANVSEDTQKVKNTAKKAETKRDTAKKAKSAKTNKDKKAALAAKQKKEEELAKIRMQKAEAKAAKKAEKKQLAAKRREEAKKRRESIKELKIKKKEERLARREALRHESKEQKAERIAAEKQARIEVKKQRQARKAEAKAEKRRLKAEMLAEKRRTKAEMLAEKRRTKAEAKERRAKERNARKVRNGSRGIGGWLAAVIALGCSCLVLATLLVWNVFMTGSGSDMLAGAYAKSFYDLVGYVDNIDVNLGKFGVSSDDGSRQKILSDIVVQASLAEDDLQALPLEDESRFYTVKYVNQLSDFGKYLNNKLIDGEKITESDLNTIAEFKKINSGLKDELNDLANTLGDGYDFTVLLNGEEDNVVLKKFNELQSNAVEYPKMIYDGPFADEPEKSAKDVKKTDNPIDENKAIDVFKNYLSDYGVSGEKIIGKADGEVFSTYQIVATAGNVNIECQISDEGKLVSFNWFMDCKDKNFNRDECIDIATGFLQKCGYKSIKPVWTTENANTVYVNFVHLEKDGVIVYSDMIKVEVCMERGKVAAMDAVKYLENHKDRKNETPALTVVQAEKKLSKNIAVESSRLAIIPLETGKEKLAYEFYGKASDGEYYIYVDASTGRELQIFKVVETDEGTLLL